MVAPDCSGGDHGDDVPPLSLHHQRAIDRSHLVAILSLTNPRLQECLVELRLWLASTPGPGVTPPEQALKLLSLQVDQQAALLAYGDGFRLVGLLFLAVIPLTLLLGRPRLLS